ncbi:PTS sugar transporter subunit IIB [Pectobacterium peruviense]|uniref:PTS cellobiose transporter subunit IIB n=1 Tax=Pectobacterium peruviense TaxID=2066479 RepID=A0ABX4S3M0_9GAMM|nr:PTS cellobiose transporter subunit IIB [Pectobacterium peruviense]KML65731.1 PTS cellobiose transporter subunit IIB [Pectobacterium peruviense]PKX82452.1 PTS cellobiose transporter subunit IIB [Pectobacterium peruviense]PKX85137.1 PTS cellobiose transporter subunit IIB [Pectobacterium peruviense]
MKKLLICCLFGNTANVLAKKMQKAADAQNYQIMISAVGLDNFASIAPAFDCFLVAPHIQYKLPELRNIVGESRFIAVIDSLPYASFDGKKVLQFAQTYIPENIN